jgi:hypothetical protein
MQRMDTSPDPQLKERRWLPLLASRLPLAIPAPVRSGMPSERFPKMWTDAPGASDFGTHPKDSRGGFEHFLEAVDLGSFGFAEDDIRAVWDDAAATPEWPGPRVWVHGDLHPANVVVADGTLAGIVDFGALFAGDPAWDLGAAWLLLPEGGASRFFDRYARADEATVRRARGLAVMKCLFLMLMGQNGDRGLPGGKPTWGPAGRSALGRVLNSL